MYEIHFMEKVASEVRTLSQKTLTETGKLLSWEVSEVMMNLALNFEDERGNSMVYVHGDLEESFNSVSEATKYKMIDIDDTPEKRRALMQWLDKVFSETHDLGAISLSNFGDDGGTRVVVQLVKKVDVNTNIASSIYHLNGSDPDHLLLMPRNPDSCIIMSCE